jgi:hypothetical protein
MANDGLQAERVVSLVAVQKNGDAGDGYVGKQECDTNIAPD